MHIPLLHEALSCLQHVAFKTSAILAVSELSEWLTIGIWKENSRQLRLVLAIWFMEVFYDRTVTLRQNQHTFGNLNQAGVWPSRDQQLSYLPKFWNKSIGRVRPIHIGIISFSITLLQTSWAFFFFFLKYQLNYLGVKVKLVRSQSAPNICPIDLNASFSAQA